MTCEFCGKFFHNRNQLGPHKRVCPEKNVQTTFSPEEDDDLFSQQDDLPPSSAIAMGGAHDTPILLRSLATRATGVWGKDQPLARPARGIQVEYDERLTVDYSHVSERLPVRHKIIYLSIRSYSQLYDPEK